METIKQVPAENRVEHEKLDAEALQKKLNRYDKNVRVTCLLLGLLSMLTIAFLVFAYFFIGVCKFFNLTFSLPALATWLDALSSIEINNPEAMLVRFIIGAFFFIIYVSVAIVLVKRLIFVINNFFSLCDLSNNRLDHKKILIGIVTKVAPSISTMCTLALLGTLTNYSFSNVFPLLILAVYIVLFLGFSIFKTYYNFNNVSTGKFYRNGFTLNLLKSFFLIVFAGLMIFFFFSSQIMISASDVIQNYYYVTDFGAINVFKFFILPITNWLLFYLCALLFGQTLNQPKLSITTNYSFYGNSYQVSSVHGEYFNSLKNKANSIISFAVILIIANAVLSCFNVKGEFLIPSYLGEICTQLAYVYLPIILLAIAINVFSKIIVKEVIPFVSLKTE